MNKKLMLLGLCMLGAFSVVQADEPESPPVAVTQETTASITTTETATTPVGDKEDKGCGSCGKR